MTPTRAAACDLRAVILLAGRVGLNPFADGVARSVLDLPAGGGATILDRWIERLSELAGTLDLASLRLLVAVDQSGPAPAVPRAAAGSRLDVHVVRDAAAYRGPAGVVKDLTREFALADRVLVATANQIQREPLPALFEALARHDESVSIVPYEGSEFAGMFLMRCSRLRDVPDVGFVDLKEQALPSARGRAPLSVVRRPPSSTLPIRTLDEYVKALRLLHGGPSMSASAEDSGNAFAETWRPVFSIIEPGAHVAPGSVVQDSVVLAGGRIEEGAAVARSVVCGTGVVQRGQSVVESIVTE